MIEVSRIENEPSQKTKKSVSLERETDTLNVQILPKRHTISNYSIKIGDSDKESNKSWKSKTSKNQDLLQKLMSSAVSSQSNM